MAVISSLPLPSASIPVAGFKDVYESAQSKKALQELPQSANEALRALYEKMLRFGGQRFAVKPSGLPQMQDLFDELPNFGVVLEHIRRSSRCASIRMTTSSCPRSCCWATRDRQDALRAAQSRNCSARATASCR